MARTPLASALQEIALSRRQFLGAAGAAAVSTAAWAPRARAAAAPNVVVVGAGLAGLTCAYRLKQAGIDATVHEASNRVGGRCWSARGAFAPGLVAERGGELIDTGHVDIRQLCKQLGLPLDNLLQAEAQGTEPLYWFDGGPYTYAEANEDYNGVYQKLHKDVSAASYPTTFEISTPRGRELDAMTIIDWIEESVPGGMSSRFGQLLAVTYTIEYGAEASEQSALNLLYLLGYIGQGRLRLFGPSNEKYHVRGGNDRITDALAAAVGGQITMGSELVAIRRTAAGSCSLTFRQGTATTTITADRVVLALPFSIMRRSVDFSKAGFGAVKTRAIRELGMATNSKLNVGFKTRHWRSLGCNGDTFSDTGYQNTWEVSRGQPGTPGILVDYTGGRIGDSFGSGTPASHATRFLAQLEPVLPGITVAVGRPRDPGRLAVLPVDARLVLVLQARPVHRLRRRRGAGVGRLLLRRGAHDAGLPGLPPRSGVQRRTSRGRGARRRRLRVATGESPDSMGRRRASRSMNSLPAILGIRVIVARVRCPPMTGPETISAGRTVEHDLEAHRRELTGYCYRMLGSGSEAEDAVQETMVRAWRGIDRLDARAALKAWLYRIATNVCLDMLSGAQRRAQPMDLGPSTTADAVLGPGLGEHAWVQPVPDALVLPDSGDPADLAVARETIRLAFVAALQHLPPKQRAVLILCEVLRWRASEAAELLDTSTAAVNSALQRARAALDAADLDTGDPAEVDGAQERALLDRYVDAFERYDVTALVALLHEDATFSMPPHELWLRGPVEVSRWLLGQGVGCRGSRLVRTAANGRPAFGAYRPAGPGVHEPFAIAVLELSGGRITAIANFLYPERFPAFGLPTRLVR